MSPGDTAIDPAALTGSWTLDPDRTSIVIHTKAMWLFHVTGTARATAGSATAEPGGAIAGTLVIDAASIDTKNKKRDQHLRTADFFEVATYPTITFTATGATLASGGRVEITGELSMHGQTRPLTVAGDVTLSGDSATLTTEVDLDRGEWGLSWNKMGAALANRVIISAHFDKT